MTLIKLHEALEGTRSAVEVNIKQNYKWIKLMQNNCSKSLR